MTYEKRNEKTALTEIPKGGMCTARARIILELFETYIIETMRGDVNLDALLTMTKLATLYDKCIREDEIHNEFMRCTTDKKTVQIDIADTNEAANSQSGIQELTDTEFEARWGPTAKKIAKKITKKVITKKVNGPVTGEFQ